MTNSHTKGGVQKPEMRLSGGPFLTLALGRSKFATAAAKLYLASIQQAGGIRLDAGIVAVKIQYQCSQIGTMRIPIE